MAAYVLLTQLCLQRISVDGPTKTRPSLLRLMWKYWPGPVVYVAMAMGLTFTVPSLYLTRFNEYAQFGSIATFWTTYAISAFAFRLKTSALSQVVGRYRLIAVGLAAQGIGLLALTPRLLATMDFQHTAQRVSNSIERTNDSARPSTLWWWQAPKTIQPTRRGS